VAPAAAGSSRHGREGAQTGELASLSSTAPGRELRAAAGSSKGSAAAAAAAAAARAGMRAARERAGPRGRRDGERGPSAKMPTGFSGMENGKARL